MSSSSPPPPPFKFRFFIIPTLTRRMLGISVQLPPPPSLPPRNPLTGVTPIPFHHQPVYCSGEDIVFFFSEGVKALASGLPKLRKVNLSGSYLLQGPLVLSLCKNCESLEELVLVHSHWFRHSNFAAAIRERTGLRSLTVRPSGFADRATVLATPEFVDAFVSLKGLTCVDLSYSCISDNFLKHLDLGETMFLVDKLFIELSLFLGNLISVNISWNYFVTDVSFFAIVRNCPLIAEIRMEGTGVGKRKVKEDSLTGLVVNSHVKVLSLAHNAWLKDKSVEMFVSVCPNLEVMDLSSCQGVSEGAVEVLRKCCKISRLGLSRSGLKLFGVNFEVSTLFVLDLSGLKITDEALFAISKSCYRLKQLDLECCHKITAKGVNQVVGNCKQLRVISLKSCEKVAADVVAWMVFASSPSILSY